MNDVTITDYAHPFCRDAVFPSSVTSQGTTSRSLAGSQTRFVVCMLPQLSEMAWKMALCPIFVALWWWYRCSLSKRVWNVRTYIRMLLPLFPNPSLHSDWLNFWPAMPLSAHLKFCACFDSYSCKMKEKVDVVHLRSTRLFSSPKRRDRDTEIDSKIDAGLPLHIFANMQTPQNGHWIVFLLFPR